MLEAICNTSPLQYLHQLDILDLLPVMYSSVLVPQAVVDELQTGRAKGLAIPDVEQLAWVNVSRVEELAILRAIPDLGRGEREVLALGTRRNESVVLLDDGLARQYARLLNLRLTGTLGVLVKAKQAGHLATIRPLLDRLDQLGFWITPAVRAKALAMAEEE